MFNKALYKQSWKANWILWTGTTLVTSFVLIIIMLLLGGSGLSNLTSSFTKTTVYETLYSNFEESSLNYYTLNYDALNDFDVIFLDELMTEIKTIPLAELDEARMQLAFENAHLKSLNILSESLLERFKIIDETIILNDNKYLELSNALMFSFSNLVKPNPAFYDVEALVAHLTQLDYFDIISTQTNPTNLYEVSNSVARDQYRKERSKNSSTTYLKTIMTSDSFIENILIHLESLGLSEETYIEFGFNELKLEYISYTAILTYQARIDYEISINGSDVDINIIIQNLKDEISINFLTSLPQELTQMLGGMENQDMYSSTIIAMYYTIVGMLIAIVYIIMAGVNLVAGQIDSGSMAYILSTGTKRSEITNTQSLFLVSSLFFMFLTTTILSLIIFTFKTPVNSQITHEKLILLGLGTFLVAFAFAGINFLTSSIFNRSRNAMAIGGGLSIVMLIFTILGIFGSDIMPPTMRMEALNLFNYLTIISLFDGKTILTGSSLMYLHFGILLLIGIVTFAASGIIFRRKDLPL